MLIPYIIYDTSRIIPVHAFWGMPVGGEGGLSSSASTTGGRATLSARGEAGRGVEDEPSGGGSRGAEPGDGAGASARASSAGMISREAGASRA